VKTNLDGRIATTVKDLTGLDGGNSSHGEEIDVNEKRKLRSEEEKEVKSACFV
jgi:hypothetical protein